MSDDWANRRPGQVPSNINAFNQRLIEEFRANRGELSGPMAGRVLMLLTTVGARSGRERTVVLGFRMDGDDYVVIASGNGAPEHPAWYRNLQQHATVRVEVGAEKFMARARIARADERDRLKLLIPYLAQQQTLTTREIPIVVFTRE